MYFSEYFLKNKEAGLRFLRNRSRSVVLKLISKVNGYNLSQLKVRFESMDLI